MSARSLFVASLLAGATAWGCGGAASPAARASASSGSGGATGSSNTAEIARSANDPRRGDATAAAPPSLLPGASSGTSSAVVASSAPTPTGTTATTATTAATGPGTASAASASAGPPRSRGGDTDEPARIGARHVLVQWMGSDRAGKSVLRTREQALVLAQEVHKRAASGDDLGRLAVEYSDEPGAGGRGGSLGRFGHGQMVGAFEQVAFKLKVGQISEIVETPFGFHIIQRTE